MSDEIVARLRLWADAVEKQKSIVLAIAIREAAAKIERLRNELDGSQLAYRGASYSCDRMRAERDEARRDVCKGEAIIRLQRNRLHRDSEEVVRMTQEISVERGWNCFDGFNK